MADEPAPKRGEAAWQQFKADVAQRNENAHREAKKRKAVEDRKVAERVHAEDMRERREMADS